MIIMVIGKYGWREIALGEHSLRDFEPVLKLVLEGTQGHKRLLELRVIIVRGFFTINTIVIKQGDGLKLLVFFGDLGKLPLVLTWEQL